MFKRFWKRFTDNLLLSVGLVFIGVSSVIAICELVRVFTVGVPSAFWTSIGGTLAFVGFMLQIFSVVE